MNGLHYSPSHDNIKSECVGKFYWGRCHQMAFLKLIDLSRWAQQSNSSQKWQMYSKMDKWKQFELMHARQHCYNGTCKKWYNTCLPSENTITPDLVDKISIAYLPNWTFESIGNGNQKRKESTQIWTIQFISKDHNHMGYDCYECS